MFYENVSSKFQVLVMIIICSVVLILSWGLRTCAVAAELFRVLNEFYDLELSIKRFTFPPNVISASLPLCKAQSKFFPGFNFSAPAPWHKKNLKESVINIFFVFFFLFHILPFYCKHKKILVVEMGEEKNKNINYIEDNEHNEKLMT